MKIPKKIKVGGHQFYVKISKTRDHAKGENWGKTIYASCTMYVDGELVKTKLEETFIHELLHIAFDHSGLNVKYKDSQEEEDIVNRLANAFYMIIKDNKIIL